MSISSNPPLPPLLTPTLPIIPNSTHSSKMPSEKLMALIFVLALQLQPGPAITTGKVGSPRMSWLPQHLTCIFATSSVAGREVLLMGGYFMMHGFMTFRSQKASFTLQMLAIHSVMCFWCHSMGFDITFESGSPVLCGM